MTAILTGWNESSIAWLPLAIIVGFVLLSLGVFTVQTATHNHQRSERVKQVGGSILFSEYFMDYGLWLMHPFVQAAQR